MHRPPLIVVMGVSGSGKSTVGALLADRLHVPFLDADDLHPITNVDKMTAGVPLTDEDRWPWLEKVGEAMASASGTGIVVACSALKRSYRDAIRSEAPEAYFVYLDGSRELLASRLGSREGHFMPATLLDSQLDALEPLGDGEPGIVISVDHSPENIVATLARELV
jgi:carbohydrate kinase (thermoresistant glucokinase family)